MKVWWLERKHERKLMLEKVNLDLNQSLKETRSGSIITKKGSMWEIV